MAFPIIKLGLNEKEGLQELARADTIFWLLWLLSWLIIIILYIPILPCTFSSSWMAIFCSVMQFQGCILFCSNENNLQSWTVCLFMCRYNTESSWCGWKKPFNPKRMNWVNCYLLTIILKLKKMSARRGKTVSKPHWLPAKKGLI